MLKIVFGDTVNSIYHPPTYFDNVYLDEWITDSFSVKMIKDIDQSDVIGPHAIRSPFLGSISTKDLSGGVKTLMLMKFDNSYVQNTELRCKKGVQLMNPRRILND